jgi:hypothetical protein
MRGFDKLAINRNLLFGLTLEEGVGTLAHDRARPHHASTLTGTPTWASIASGLSVLEFLNAHPDFIQCPAAATADLNFTSGDFSMAVWFWPAYFDNHQALLCRGVLNVDGWRLWIVSTPQLRFETSQAGANQASYTDSPSAIVQRWSLWGMSRSGSLVSLYHNGIDRTSVAGSHTNPTGANRKLHIGILDDEASYPVLGDAFAKGKKWNPRIWGRKLESWEHMAIFNAERHLFGV